MCFFFNFRMFNQSGYDIVLINADWLEKNLSCICIGGNNTCGIVCKFCCIYVFVYVWKNTLWMVIYSK